MTTGNVRQTAILQPLLIQVDYSNQEDFNHISEFGTHRDLLHVTLDSA